MMTDQASRNRKVAIVTGGAGGMGREMCLGLLWQGYDVAAVDRHAAALAALKDLADAQGSPGRLLTVTADLTVPSVAAGILKKTEAALGGVDILVNNAGIGNAVMWKDNWQNPIKLWDIRFDQWRVFFDINTDAAFNLIRVSVPGMIERGWGRVVSVTTSLSSMLRRGAPYGPSKAATESMMACLANDLEGSGVTANVLVPGGLTNTNFVPEGAPFNRDEMLQPAIMVPPLLWLASEDANDFNGRRIVAKRWDPALQPREAFAEAGAPIGWPVTGSESIRPRRIA